MELSDFRSRVANEDGTIIDRLKRWGGENPDVKCLTFYEKGQAKVALTFQQLWLLIELYAADIGARAKPGDRVVILAEPGMDFIVLFYACLRACAIAVPAFPPTPGSEQRGIDAFTKVASVTSSRLILMSQKLALLKRWRGRWPTTLPHGSLHYLTLQSVPEMLANLERASSISLQAASSSMAMPKRTDVAFLQFTSGSTGSPKGVVIDHHNLACNCCHGVALMRDKQAAYDFKIVCTNWLPMYHDMGLVLATCSPLYFGGQVHFMSPLDFLADPLSWLDLISLTRSNSSMAPNFAFNLVNRKWQSVRARRWDLSSLRCLFNSAEPIQLSTCQTFMQHMQQDVPSFPMDCLGVGYGMAESVAAIGISSFPHPLIESALHAPLVASVPFASFFGNTRIVNPHSLQPIEAQGEVGEIWVQSSCVSRGYWELPELTFETFQNTLPDSTGYWMRTGDLCFMEDGHLFISGRLKDVIIINGRNFYPQDIEACVFSSADDSLRPGCCAAFPVSLSDTEGFVVVVEVRQTCLAKGDVLERCEQIVQQIDRAVRLAFSLSPHEIVLIRERTAPKTTSGKIRRKETKRQWETDALQTLLKFSSGGCGRDFEVALSWLADSVRQAFNAIRDHEPSVTITEDAVVKCEETCRQLLISFNILEKDETLASQGLDSLRLVEVVATLRAQLFADLAVDIADLSSLTSDGLVKLVVRHVSGVDTIGVEDNITYPSNYPTRVSDYDTLKAALEPMYDALALQRDFSVARRILGDFLVLFALFASIVVSLLPSIYLYRLIASRLSSPWSYWEINIDSEPYWITLGFVIILTLPCFFVSFTIVWVAQKWMLVGKYRTGFIPIFTLQYYLWLYVDRLSALWEVAVFTFIADSPIANLVYMLAGASVHLDSVISTPLRCPDLVSVGQFAEVEGFLYPQQLLPHGVSMGSISIDRQVWVRTGSVVHRGSILRNHIQLQPLSVVPPYHELSSDKVWQGNICVAVASYSPDDVNVAKHRFIQCSKVLVLCALPWMSLLGSALASRFWFLVFPEQPLTTRLGDFWFQVWLFYGTGLAWSVFVLLAKEFLLGKARRGPYTPSTLTKCLRHALAIWNNMAMRLFWSHFQLNLTYLWSRLLGATVSPTATLVTNCVAHPADADLIEILDDARVSTVVFQPYDKENGSRGRISVGCSAEVGHYSVLSAGVNLEADASVGSRVYLPSDVHIASKHQITSYTPAGQRMALDRKKSFSFNRDLSRFELHVSDSIAFRLLCLVSEASAAIVPWLPVWLAYFLYRVLSKYHVLAGLFGSLSAGLCAYLVMFAVLHRLWELLENHSGDSPATHKAVVLLWRWLHQVKFVFAQSVGVLVGGSVLLNCALTLAGSSVSMSAVIMYVHLNDWSKYDIEDFAVINEQAFPFGHVLQKNQMRFGRARCGAFSCMQPFSVLLPNQMLGAKSSLGSHVTAIQDVYADEAIGTAYKLPFPKASRMQTFGMPRESCVKFVVQKELSRSNSTCLSMTFEDLDV